MPHLTLEYSANLAGTGNFKTLCQDLAQSLVAQGGNAPTYPIGGIRVRAIRCDDFCIGDGSLNDAAFVHGTLKIGAGRSDAQKKSTLEALFNILSNHFEAHFLKHGLALSLELYEFSEAGTLKRNNLHALFKKD